MEPDASSLRDALARVDTLRAEIDAMRPLPPDVLGRAMQRLQLEWTYHSNAIEGNSLDYGETRALLLHGVTAHGKPLKDHLDIRRHREVLEFLEGFVRSDEPLTLAVVREIHRRLMGDTYEVQAETPDGQRIRREERGGEFKTHPNHVRTATDEIHYYATPEETPARMTDLMDAYTAQHERVARGELHPVVLAATLHHGFVEIHPFPDGNGRLSRVLMNLLLMRAGYPPAVIRTENRAAYFGALAQADAGDLAPFVEFVTSELEATMDLYLRALRNEPDPDAFDRRVALLKREFETTPRELIPRSPEMLAVLTRQFFRPLLDRLDHGREKLMPLFESDSGIFHITRASGTEYIEPPYLNALMQGDWTKFQVFWRLDRFRLAPVFGLRFEVACEAGETELVVGVHPAPSGNHEHRYHYADLPGEDDARRLAEGMLNEALDAAEAARLLVKERP